MASLVHMQATQPVSDYQRLLLARRAELEARLQPVKARLDALQSQLADNGPAMGAKAGHGGNKGKKRDCVLTAAKRTIHRCHSVIVHTCCAWLRQPWTSCIQQSWRRTMPEHM